MKAAVPPKPTSMSPWRRQTTHTASATVVDLPGPTSRGNNGISGVWVETLFRELFFVLKLHGLRFYASGLEERSSVSGTTKRRRLQLVRAAAFAGPTVCAAYVVHCAASLALALKSNQDAMMTLLPDVSDVCRVLVSFMTAAHGALNGAKVFSLLRRSAAAMSETHSSSIVHSMKPSSWSAVRRTVLASSSFALLSCLVFVGLRVSTLRRRGLRAYCQSYLYGFDPSGGDGGPAAYALPALDALLYGVILAMPRWSIALHVSLCHFLGAMGEQVSDCVRLAAEPQGRLLGAAEVRELRFRHALLCRTIGHCDDIYSWLLFFWCGDLVLCFIFGVPWIMVRADTDELGAYAAASIDVTLAVVLLVVLFVAASEPGHLAKESLTPHVLRLSCCDYKAGGASASRTHAEEVALNQELLMLSTAVRGSRVEMSGWDCFDVHRGTTITVMSMLATYAVVVYQMLHHID
ncbi:hypothetical protein HPB52_013114 [Rhipicephalus sanguineus]|uniref:Gustatory receptor n=1 Tax=Rhipicephalus sanguineus TaxID=34632 RepID=A0A9D4PW78_RHISA|nr:hypothetical protein HPB52_013114 [Rhipicephalus sanguineus]